MPEKNLSAVPRPLREAYEKARLALDRNNWDYAVQILNQILEKEPECYECRQALRGIQLEKAKTGTSFFKKMLGTAARSPILARAQLALRNDPWEAIRLAEQILASDPHSSQAHKVLADAALQLDMPKTAAFSLEIAFRDAPHDKEAASRLGEALIKAGQPARAEMIFIELAKAYPTDPAIAQALKNFTAHKTLSEGGYEKIAGGGGSYRTILKDAEEAVSLEQENKQHKTEDVAGELIEQYRRQLEREPGNLKLIRSVAELHVQRQEFDEALAAYDQIMKSETGKDPSLEKAVADTVLRKFDHAIAQIAQPGDEESRARLISEREAYRLSECKGRADRYPNDLYIRFELGEIYFKAGKIIEAIQEFQKAQGNPNRRIASLNYLGQGFALRGMHDLATSTFEGAIKEKVVFDEEMKDLMYRLGLSLEKLGKPDQAIAQFKAIYQADIGYRDVAARVDAFYKSAQS